METNTTAVDTRPRFCVSEILSFAYETFQSNKVRFALTALGMVIGTASLILVTTISLTGKQYLLFVHSNVNVYEVDNCGNSGLLQASNIDSVSKLKQYAKKD